MSLLQTKLLINQRKLLIINRQNIRRLKWAKKHFELEYFKLLKILNP